LPGGSNDAAVAALQDALHAGGVPEMELK